MSKRRTEPSRASSIPAGCREGLFVLRLTRPDRSVKTFWRTMPGESALKDPSLEVVLSEHAELTEISTSQLTPQSLPGLWGGAEIMFNYLCEYFGVAML